MKLKDKFPKLKIYVQFNDGTEKSFIATNPDMIRYETRSEREKWPEKGAFLKLTYLSFCAAKRLKEYEGTWEEWQNEVEYVSAPNEEDLIETDPFPKEAEQDF